MSAANECDIECEHEKMNSISPSVHVLFCSLFKLTDDGVFDNFPDFRPLSEDFRRFSKIVLKVRGTFSNIFREFPKIPEDVRRFPKTFEEDSKMFR